MESCSTSLTKHKGKLSSKQVNYRLHNLAKFIDKYGLASGPNSVPILVVDFAILQLSNPASEVRT